MSASTLTHCSLNSQFPPSLPERQPDEPVDEAELGVFYTLVDAVTGNLKRLTNLVEPGRRRPRVLVEEVEASVLDVPDAPRPRHERPHGPGALAEF